MTVPFLDLVGHHRPFREDLLIAFAEILDTASFVNGPRVESFEQAFAEAHDVEECVAVGNGTVALELAFRALDIGPQDHVIVPANTFIATAEAVSNVGATPVLVDCDSSSRNISVRAVAEALERTPVSAVAVVHLYGQPAEMSELLELTEARGIPLVEDAAQAHQAEYRGRKVGGLGSIAGFSFYPGKNLGGLGEGGAVTTNDPTLANRVRSLRDHGQTEKYRSGIIGTNARMSEVVGAGLGIELPYLSDWNSSRQRAADRYRARLEHLSEVELPSCPDHIQSVHHLFVIHIPHRDVVQSMLKDLGVRTGLHYPIPIHLQAAYLHLGHQRGDFPNSEWSSDHLLSLPMFPGITDVQIDRVCDALAHALSRGTA